ncbi:SPOUT methylase [Cryptosporidium sp. chipmunk genotype I]|uniref:SPOUT methylase n=1 Tax=Cryptosporidium sp. chipmunk genotype I TaxID=1280935 RepID=UPI003519EF82|nr:SPOUT methylase [Cryptosporidium sp. chipmunk genotype I]
MGTKKTIKGRQGQSKHNPSSRERSRSKRPNELHTGFQTNLEENDDILSRIPFAGSPSKSTLSVAIPASIVGNAQSFELRAYLVGQIARIISVFGVDEIIIYEDKCKDVTDNENRSSKEWVEFACSKWMEFFVKNLKYLETPQYLRKTLFKFDNDFKFAGLQNPIDAPHHMRISEWLPYRQGVIVPGPKFFKGSILPDHRNKGSWVNCGLPVEAWIETEIKNNTRVTIKMSKESESLHKKLCSEFKKSGRYPEIKSYFTGKLVEDSAPYSKKGIYWGYKVRPANSLKSVFSDSEYEGGYDLKIGTSERGEPVDNNFTLFYKGKDPKSQSFKHILIVFGGLGGLEDVLSDPQCSLDKVKDPSSLFDMYINICPEQRSRTIRTEEALGLTLALLRPHLLENNKNL